ncbi:hypothetical protein [Polyangium sorediatum]|uniref:Uncharacterized protein n=1 Tax=Polyangium sorediatum TaxID=889274 RepID=A0ABT6P1R9_9BACT|nr:hypothetical protein [Polyangium sorediatum]MDI1434535.1 hypothetical protein [Polyangium sorediatum]
MNFFREETLSNFSGRNDSGVVFGSTVQRPARSFAGEEAAQFLRHLSTYFFYYANHFLEKSDAEVEAMYTNERILISANNPKTMEQLYQQLLKEPTLLDAIRTIPSTSSDRRGARVVDRFQDEMMSPDLTEDVQFLAQGLAMVPIRESVEQIALRTAGPRTDVLVEPHYREKLILVTGLGVHAEQKLLLVLINSRLPKTTPVLVRGKKRPCFGCWLCLYFVADVMGYNLNYNTRPGKSWTNSIDGLKAIIDKALGIDVPKKVMREWGDKVIREYAAKKIHSHVSTVYGTGAEDPGFDSESDDDLDSYT